MLQVKTLGAGHPDPGYVRTRAFYRAGQPVPDHGEVVPLTLASASRAAVILRAMSAIVGLGSPR